MSGNQSHRHIVKERGAFEDSRSLSNCLFNGDIGSQSSDGLIHTRPTSYAVMGLPKRQPQFLAANLPRTKRRFCQPTQPETFGQYTDDCPLYAVEFDGPTEYITLIPEGTTPELVTDDNNGSRASGFSAFLVRREPTSDA
jgi:hypothetical protein